MASTMPSTSVVAATRSPPSPSDEAFQEASLERVSRTFALTIPLLPTGVRRAVANGYLLCRIADTIEDDPALPHAEKRLFAEAFIAAVEGQGDASTLAQTLAARLAPEVPRAEVELVEQIPAVLRITHDLNPSQQAALTRCVAIMSRGMADFQARDTAHGVADLRELERYCYYVAGVVGEMLTEVFCDYHPTILRQREELMGLAVSFGQALQMTNIIKDIWEDRRRGVCWLPRDLFLRHGCDLSQPDWGPQTPGFTTALDELVGVARSHLQRALLYVERLPSSEAGIRRFCLWALGMAVMTLRKVHASPGFRAGQEVKITRRTVRWTVLTMNLLTRSNILLRLLFKLLMRGLPTTAYRDNIQAPSKLCP